jgi:hypothetical protein
MHWRPLLKISGWCSGVGLKFSRQKISIDLKSSYRQRVGNKNTVTENRGTTVRSLASAALEFQESHQQPQDFDDLETVKNYKMTLKFKKKLDIHKNCP